MITFYVVTIFGKDGHQCNVIEKQAESFEGLVAKIQTTQRGKMEYSVFKGKPFTHENFLYQHRP